MSRFLSKTPLVTTLIVALASLGVTPSARAVWFGTYGTWDSAARQNAANAAMTAVCNRFNAYGNFNGGSDGWVDVYYNSGVPTANASWAGSMTFGGTWPGERVAMHELNHWLGSVYGHNMNGTQAVATLEQFNGVGARFGNDGTHFWPYGMNYDNEWSEIAAQRNVAIMYAQRRDWGITTGNPTAWAATSVTLTGSDAAGESGFNYGSKWSDDTFAHPNAAYSTGAFALRTPPGDPSWTFRGASLTINTGGQLLYNSWGTGGIIRINGLILDGGTIKHDQNPQDFFQLAGSITVAAGGGTINAADGDIKILAPIGGGGSLTKTGGYTTTLSGQSSFTGNLTINNGVVAAAYGANTFTVNGRATGAFGNEQTAGKTVTINNGATLSFTVGNVLGSGASSLAQAPVMGFVVNPGGILKTATADVGGVGEGDANIFGPLTLNGGTFTTGNGYDADYQAAIFLKEVTVGGSSASTLNSDANNEVANGIMLGDAASGTDLISFNVADVTADANADLIVTARLTNSANSTTNPAAIGGLTKTGAGTMVMSTTNTYTGPTHVNGGTLAYTAAQPNMGSITAATGAKLQTKALEAGSTTLTPTSLTLATGSTLTFDLNGLDSVSPQISTGVFTASGAVNVTVLNGGALPAGTYKLVNYTSFAGGGTFSGASFPIGPRSTGTLSNNGTNGLFLTVTGGDRPVWTGLDNGNWQTAATGGNKNWKLLSAATATDYLEGDNALFNDTATGTTAINIVSGVSPIATTFTNPTKNYTLGGAGIGGAGGLTKTGAGSLTLTTANTFTGNVVVNGGTLYANTANGAANRAFSYVSGITIHNGGTLRASSNALFGWNGTQEKPITVNAGGILTANGGLTSDVGVGTVTLAGGTLATLAGGATDYGSWRFDNAADRLLVTEDSIASAQNVKFGNVGALIDVAAGKTLNFSGTITNTTAGGISYLNKTGAGTLVLSGANTFSGAATISGGIVSINANNNLGANAVPVLLNGATLRTTNTVVLGISHAVTFDGNGNELNIAGNGAGTINQGSRVYFGTANTFLGDGALTVTGGGTLNGAAPNTRVAGVGALVIGAANTYSGNIILQNGGMIEYAAATALGTATVILGNEGEFSITNGTTSANAITVTGGTNSVLSFTNATGTSSGPITLNADLTVGLRNWYNYDGVKSGTISGVISGTGGLTVNSGTGTGGVLTLTGSNTFTGNVTVSGATLYANPGNAANNRALSFVSGITVNNGGTLRASPNGLFGWNGTQEKPIVVNAGGTLLADGGDLGDVGVGSVTLAGGTLASTAESAAWGTWRFDNAADRLFVTENSTASATNVKFGNAGAAIDVSAGKTLNFTGTITNATAGGISYLTKAGAGTLTLAGVNTYTGATAVNAGTLKLTGSLAAGTTVTVASGATLTGAGTVGGALSFATNAIHAPGDSVGTQNVNGTLSYANGSRVKWTLPTNSDAAGAASRIAAANVNVTAGAALDLVLNGAGSATDFTNGFWTQARSWTVMTGTISGTFTLGTVSADAAGHPASNYGTFALQQNGSTVILAFTPANPRQVWQQANFGANSSDPAIAGDTADPDKDGVANLLERAMSMNPNAGDSTLLPAFGKNGSVLSITYRKAVAATDVTFVVQESTNLTSWTTAAGTETPLTNDGTAQTVRYDVATGGAPTKFLRVQVLAAP